MQKYKGITYDIVFGITKEFRINSLLTTVFILLLSPTFIIIGISLMVIDKPGIIWLILGLLPSIICFVIYLRGLRPSAALKDGNLHILKKKNNIIIPINPDLSCSLYNRTLRVNLENESMIIKIRKSKSEEVERYFYKYKTKKHL